MNPLARLNRFFNKLPVHLAVIVMCLLWVIPTLGLFVTSFRTRQAVNDSGWWTVFSPQPKAVGLPEYTQYCSACHGVDGNTIPTANLSDPNLVNQFPSAASLLVMLRQPVNGKPHLSNPTLPTAPRDALNTLTPIVTYLQTLSGQNKSTGGLTLSNYVDALVGYKGTQNYLSDCKNQVPSTQIGRASCRERV